MFFTLRGKIGIFLLSVLLFQITCVNSQTLDTTKIGVEVNQVYQGYVVGVNINQTGVQGVYGKSLDAIKVGDPTEQITITNIDNSTGDVTLYHTNYGLPGWDGTTNMKSMCSNVVYTDWTYWNDSLQSQLTDPVLNVHIFENTNYFGYISEGNGSETTADGVTTIVGHRQDCIYNKQSGFQEFFGLFEERYYTGYTEVTYTAQQFLLTTDQRETNSSLYFELISGLNTTINPVFPPRPTTNYSPPQTTRSSTPSTTTTSTEQLKSSTPTLALNYPIQISLFLIILLPILRRFRGHKFT